MTLVSYMSRASTTRATTAILPSRSAARGDKRTRARSEKAWGRQLDPYSCAEALWSNISCTQVAFLIPALCPGAADVWFLLPPSLVHPLVRLPSARANRAC